MSWLQNEHFKGFIIIVHKICDFWFIEFFPSRIILQQDLCCRWWFPTLRCAHHVCVHRLHPACNQLDLFATPALTKPKEAENKLIFLPCHCWMDVTLLWQKSNLPGHPVASAQLFYTSTVWVMFLICPGQTQPPAGSSSCPFNFPTSSFRVCVRLWLGNRARFYWLRWLID